MGSNYPAETTGNYPFNDLPTAAMQHAPPLFLGRWGEGIKNCYKKKPKTYSPFCLQLAFISRDATPLVSDKIVSTMTHIFLAENNNWDNLVQKQ